MDHQQQEEEEEGWPLGLRRALNSRVGLLRRNPDHSGSISFSTLLTASPTSSSVSSSDLDTQSSGSFFHDRSITLGSLIGISNILEMSRRSTRRATHQTSRNRKISIPKPAWLFSLCSKLNTDAVITTANAPSLGHFLQEERRAASTIPYDSEQPNSNSLFVGGRVGKLLEQDNGGWYGLPLLFSCVRPQLIE